MPPDGLEFQPGSRADCNRKGPPGAFEFPDKSFCTCFPVEQFPDLLYSISEARLYGRNGAADAARHGIERKLAVEAQTDHRRLSSGEPGQKGLDTLKAKRQSRE